MARRTNSNPADIIRFYWNIPYNLDILYTICKHLYYLLLKPFFGPPEPRSPRLTFFKVGSIPMLSLHTWALTSKGGGKVVLTTLKINKKN